MYNVSQDTPCDRGVSMANVNRKSYLFICLFWFYEELGNGKVVFLSSTESL